MLKRLFLSVLLVVLGSSFCTGADPDAILGTWNTSDMDGKIEIYKCGNAYCGKIVHLKKPNFPKDDDSGMAGLPKVDRNNPIPEMRDRPLLGLILIEGFHYSGNNTYEGGKIYNPEDGREYKAKITLQENNRLLLRGFIGIPLIGRTETWTRAKG